MISVVVVEGVLAEMADEGAAASPLLGAVAVAAALLPAVSARATRPDETDAEEKGLGLTGVSFTDWTPDGPTHDHRGVFLEA
mmetsp:Transcript_936/g.1717  ORF Transcript_936/g.1717 Transcript_936/m.1717 type:complete len:82 (+) Transcript_936:385-630(+)